jgi:hypothetical protein
MERQISGRSGPVYPSRMVNRVVPSVPGARVKVHALEQAQRHAAAPGHPLTRAELGHPDREGAARVALDTTLIFSPDAMVPSTRSTPESHAW